MGWILQVHRVWESLLKKKKKNLEGWERLYYHLKKSQEGFGDGLVSVSSAQARAGEEEWDLKVALVPSLCSFAALKQLLERV